MVPTQPDRETPPPLSMRFEVKAVPSRRFAMRPLRSRPLLVLAEDEAGIRGALASLLRENGYRVLEACDGRELLAILQRVRPDVVLTDIAMPVCDGVEATRSIRANPDLFGVPVVAVTATWLGERSDVLRDAGFSAAVRKPASADELLSVVEGLLQPMRAAHAS